MSANGNRSPLIPGLGRCFTWCHWLSRIPPRLSQWHPLDRSNFLAALFVLGLTTCSTLAFAEDEKPAFTILFTAEAHGALLPCDCPLQPLGGVARRATLIKRYRARGPVLLVDAGGWEAGGMYDEDSDGDPERDALRSRLMAKTMSRMGYASAAWSNAQWRQWSNEASRRPVASPRQTWEARGNFLGELAGVVPERPLNATRMGPLYDPAKHQQNLWQRAQAGTQGFNLLTFVQGGVGDSFAPQGISALGLKKAGDSFSIALAQLGEEESEKLAAEFKLFDLIVSAGRKTTTRVAWSAGNTVVANFDYQVQRLGVAEIFPRKGWKDGAVAPRWEIRVKHEPITPEIPDDPEIAALLAPHLESLKKKGKRKVEVEFWTLPECPYCVQLAPEVERIAADLAGRAEVVPHFLVSKDADGKLRAMHDGKGAARELHACKVQALVARYYPEKFWAWLRWSKEARNREAPWEEGAKALGLLRARIAGALWAGEGDELLERDYQRSLSRRVQGTPTLVIANKIYEGDYERLKVLRVLCGLLDEPKPEVCRLVPACFLDRECKRRGFIGRCLDPGVPAARCDFSRQALPVQATVLLDPEALWSNHERILEILLGYLPGLDWKIVTTSSAEGRTLLERLKPERLPAYLLDPSAKTEARYEENLGAATEARDGRLLLKGPLTGAHRIVARPRLPGRADLFVSRFSKAGQEALDVALAAGKERDAPELVLHDALYWSEKTLPGGQVTRELAARGGVAEIEDAALALAVRRVAPEKLQAYLKERGLRRGSQFGWDRALLAAGVDPAQVRPLAEGPDEKGPVDEIRKALHAEADLLKELGAGGDVVLLGENCELIPLHAREELRYYLERIGKRKP